MKLDHIFFNIATSAPFPAGGEITELSAIRTDSDGDVKASFDTKIDTNTNFKDSIRGLNEALLAGNSDKLVLVSYISDFNSNFLHKACQRAEIESPFAGRAWVDPYQIAWILVYGKEIVDRKLTTLANYYGVSIEHLDTVKGDVEILMQIYFRMMKRFQLGSKIESYGRNLVGEAISGVLKAVGQKVG